MMMKKAAIQLDYSLYGKYMYKGLNRYLMKANHALLNYGISPEHNRHILEIGGGVEPHYKWVTGLSFETYLITDITDHADSHGEGVGFISHEDFRPENYEKKFSRIIASHVLEHIQDPEAALLNWVSMLDEKGILSIALPCDPGLAWHFCRRISAPKARKVYGISPIEHRLIMAREHINSIDNLLAFIDYYFASRKTYWFPSLFASVNLNLLCIIQLSRKDFRNNL
jgi:SAM-dependent methyltransferase